MTLARVGCACPYLAEDNVMCFGIAVFIDLVLRIADLHSVLQITRMRSAVKVFVTAQVS